MSDQTPAPEPAEDGSFIERLSSSLRGYFLIEGSPIPLGIYRILLGLTIMYEAHHNFRRIAFYTPDTFHFPYVGFIKPLPIGDLPRRIPADDVLWAALEQLAWPDTIEMLFTWQFVFATMLMLGLLTRVGALGVLMTQGYALFICQLNFRNHIYLTLLCVLLILFSPAGRALSLDDGFKRVYEWLLPDKKRQTPEWVPLMTQRLIGIQIAMMYFWATTHKLSPGFLSGYPMGRAVSRAITRARPASWLFSPEQLQQLSEFFADPQWQPLLAYMTVFAEGFLAVGLFFRSTRLAAVCIGIGLHFGIFLMMDIHTFGMLSVSAYICFWVPRARPIPIAGLPTPRLKSPGAPKEAAEA